MVEEVVEPHSPPLEPFQVVAGRSTGCQLEAVVVDTRRGWVVVVAILLHLALAVEGTR